MYRTAEFVSPHHPDKLCDRISDTILDLYLKGDPDSRCAIEVCGGHEMLFITGEVTSKELIMNDDIKGIVFDLTGVNNVIINIIKQSPEIARGVDIGGAGDQGVMTGYACRENEDLVPHEYFLARNLNRAVFQKFPYDGKTQVTLISGDKENEVDCVSVVCSFQNAPKKELEEICRKYFTSQGYHIYDLHCNPAGDWSIGGFSSDAGLTGRKLAVDNYGPRVPIGGGAFSGKDATKVDRSGAYMARRIAVDYLDKYPNTQEVFVQLSYAIGKAHPIQATALLDGKEIDITEYDLTPRGIIEFLDLKNPIFSQTAEWGHMGNNFKWK